MTSFCAQIPPSYVPPTSASALATINLSAVRANFCALKHHAQNMCEIAPVVKANAYGLGMHPIVNALKQEGAKRFFVATLEEGLSFRKKNPDTTVHILNGLWSSAMEMAIDANLTPVLGSQEQLKSWQTLAHKKEKKAPFWLQVDTGLTRLGVSIKEALAVSEQKNGLYPEGIMSHLSSAYSRESAANKKQLLAFRNISQHFSSCIKSFANSGALLLGPTYYYDVARVGRFLYGSVNGAGSLKSTIKPVVNLKARILQIQDIKKGTPVGYDETFKAQTPMRLATVSLGYSDGYFQSISNKGYAEINGFKTPVVGRISMDLTTLDVTHVPEKILQEASWASFLNDHITIDHLASWANTNVWEILTNLGKRAAFHYVS